MQCAERLLAIDEQARAPPYEVEEVARLNRLRAAVHCVCESDGKISVRSAAIQHNVHKSTIHRHVQISKGIFPKRRRSGSKRLRLLVEEQTPLLSAPNKAQLSYILN